MRTTASIVVPGDRREVFAFLAEVANESRWRSSVVGSGYEGVDLPALGVVGWTQVEMGGRGVRMRWTITELEPDAFVRWVLDGDPWRGGGSYRVEAAPDGSRVTAALEVRVRGASRMLEPLLWLAFRRGLRADLARLAAVRASALAP